MKDQYCEFKSWLRKKNLKETLKVVETFESTADIQELESVISRIECLKDKVGEIRIKKETIHDGSSGLYLYNEFGPCGIVGITFTITLTGVKSKR